MRENDLGVPSGRDAPSDERSTWSPMDTAPKNATWIVGRYRQPFGQHYYLVVHWADSSGEGEQPAFRGWFTWGGGSGFHQVNTPDDWQPLEREVAISSYRLRVERLEEALRPVASWLRYAYGHVSSVTADKVKEHLPKIDAALSIQPEVED